MRITMVDRWLLLGCLLCMLVVGASGDLFSACDNKCCHVQWYFEDVGTSPIDCFDLTEVDCWPCASGVAPGSCDDKNLPGKDTCRPNEGKTIKRSKATGCALKCTLAPLGLAEAKAG